MVSPWLICINRKTEDGGRKTNMAHSETQQTSRTDPDGALPPGMRRPGEPPTGWLSRSWTLLKEDVESVLAHDPAARGVLEVVLCYPGLHAIWLHRLAHGLWTHRLRLLGRFVSHLNRFLTGVEIHPGATMGRRCFIDHGMGVVVGETAEVGDDVLIYKGVVLGGVSLEKKKRHPTIGHSVVLGSNAVVLGPIKVGDGARVGSGSVVVKPVPPAATVVGVPGRVVKVNGVRCRREPDLHHERLPDPVVETVQRLEERIAALEEQLKELSRHQKEPSGEPVI